MIWLTVATIVAVLLLVGVLVVGLVKIIGALEAIGGTSTTYLAKPSLLSKARWGVRAIEVQTAALGPQVTALNAGLVAIDAGLATVEQEMGGLAGALSRQDEGSGA